MTQECIIVFSCSAPPLPLPLPLPLPSLCCPLPFTLSQSLPDVGGDCVGTSLSVAPGQVYAGGGLSGGAWA